jgi:hypothetical protein
LNKLAEFSYPRLAAFLLAPTVVSYNIITNNSTGCTNIFAIKSNIHTNKNTTDRFKA